MALAETLPGVVDVEAERRRREEALRQQRLVQAARAAAAAREYRRRGSALEEARATAIARAEFEKAERRRSAALQLRFSDPTVRANFTRAYEAARQPDPDLFGEMRQAVENGRGQSWLRENLTRVQQLDPNARNRVLVEVYQGGEDLPDPGRLLGALAENESAPARAAMEVGQALPSDAVFNERAFAVGHRVGEDLKRAGEQIAQTAADMPYGLYLATKPIAVDSASALAATSTFGQVGDMDFNRSREFYPQMVKETGRQVWMDITNPEERLGYLLMDLLAVGSLGAGGVVRTGSAGRAGAAAMRARAAVPEGDLRRPSIADVRREVRRGFVQGNPPQTAPLVIRQPMELDAEGQIVHPGGQITVNKLLPRNVLARNMPLIGARARIERIQNRLDAGPREPWAPAPEVPFPIRAAAAIGNRAYSAFDRHLGAQAVVGRELRAHRRVDEAAERALPGELAGLIGSPLSEAPRLEALPERLRFGLTRGQQTIAALVARDGDVVLEDPHGAINHWQAYYQRQAMENAGDERLVAGAERTIADLDLARKAADELTNPTPGRSTKRFLEAVRIAQALTGPEGRRPQRYAERGLASPESLAFRLAGPSAIGRGEQLYDETQVVRTRAEIPRARELTRDVRRIEREVATLERQFGKTTNRVRPRTPEEAQRRLDELNVEYESWLDNIVETIMSGPERRVEQARRNIANRRRFTSSGRMRGRAKEEGTYQFEASLRRQETGAGGQRVPSIKTELRKRAEALIDKAIAARPDDLKMKEMKALIEERRALEVGLGKFQERGSIFAGLDDPVTGPKAEAAAKVDVPGTETERIVTAKSRPKGMSTQEMALWFGTEKLGPDPSKGARLSQMREYLEKRRTELARALQVQIEVKTIKDETIRRRRDVGDPPPGSFYYSERAAGETAHGLQSENVGRFVTPQGGKHGIPPQSPARKDPGLGHEWEGELLQQGRARLDALSSVVRAADVEIRLLSALDMYDKAWGVSHATRETEYDVPIRSTSRISGEVRELFDRLDRNQPITKAEVEQMLADPKKEGLLDNLAAHLHPLDFKDDPIGTDMRHAGIRWVDRRLLADLGGVDTGVGRGFVRAADMVNNPARLLYVYGRVAYLLNLPGNFGMQAMTQGWLAPFMYKRAWNVRKKYGNDVAAMMESFVGEGKARATYVPSGFMARPTQALANFWSSFIDRPSRISSLLYEMRRQGVDLDDPKAVERFLGTSSKGRTAVVRRANKNMVDFTNLTPFERNTLRHFIFLYPWVSRATVWAGRTVIEHPGKTWVLGELAQQAYDHREDEIGKLPSYLEDRGYFPVSVMNKDAALLVNPTAINTFSTAAENGRLLSALIVQPVEKRSARAAVSPALDALIGSLTGVTELGREYEEGGAVGAVKELAEATPIYQAARRAGIVDKPKGEIPLHQQRTFQGKGIGEVAGPFLAGGLYPRYARLDVTRERRRQEDLAGMSPGRRAIAKIDFEVSDMRQAAIRTGLYSARDFDDEMGEPIRLWKQRESAYAIEAEKQGIPINRLSSLERTKLDLNLMVRLGYYDRDELQILLEELELLTDTELKSYRRQLHEDYFGASVLSSMRTTLREATE